MKSIGYVIPQFPVLSETFVGVEMRAMERVGHRILPIAFRTPDCAYQPIDSRLHEHCVYLYKQNAWKSAARLLSSQISQRTFLSRWKAAIHFTNQQKGIRPRSLLKQGVLLAGVTNLHKLDHLHAQFAQHTTATAIVAAKLLGITVSFVGYGSDVYATPSDLPVKLAVADLAVAVCKEMQTDFLTIQPCAKTELIYCGVEEERFLPKPKTCNNRLLFVGRLVETKGADNLIESIALMPPSARVAVDIVGTGVLEGALRSRVKELGLDDWIHFLGAKPAEWIQDEGPAYMGLIAPFKQAQNGARDTGPLVVKEAMAMALPVITTNFMGCREFVTEQTGWKVAPDDSGELANAVKCLRDLPEGKRRAMGEAGRRRIMARFTSNSQALVLSHTIESLTQ